jgi:hypothetical protein
MRPNLASASLLEQPSNSGCGVRLLARVRQRVRRVDLPTPSITVAYGVCTSVVDPATSWDEPGCPLLAHSSCEPPGDWCAPPLARGSCEPPGDCCAPPLAPGSCEPPGDGTPLAPGSCEAPNCGPPVAPGN